MINDLQHLVKQQYGYRQQDVSSNLDYLVQIQWVVKDVESRKITISGVEREASRTSYKISALGIDKVEGASLYKAPALAGSMNITNVSGVVITGDGNVVNSHFSDGSRAIAELRKVVVADRASPDPDRLAMLSDIDSLTAQLQKPTPNYPVIRMLWAGVQAAATVDGAAALLNHIAGVLAPYLQ